MTETEEIHSRLSLVEARIEQIEKQHASLLVKMDVLVNNLNTLVKDAAVAAVKVCPEPGACVPLRATLKDAEIRLTALEGWRREAVGMIHGSRATLSAIWAVIGGCVVFIIQNYLKR